MRKKPLFMLAMAFIMLFAIGQSAWAFKDVADHSNASKINTLKERGILSGNAKEDRFNPDDELTYAAGISMLVKGLELNIDHIRFIKEPKASDHFPNLKDDAWYSEAFVIAYHNGLDIPEQVNANDAITKEQFGHHLYKSIMTKGEFAFPSIFIMIEDEADINPSYMDSAQKLLITKIAALDENQKFYPKQNITRGTAAGWLYDSIEFVEKVTPIPNLPDLSLFQLELSVEPVNDDVNKVSISGQLPHPGYGLRIGSIVFDGELAIINIDPIMPDPDKMYPQVITDVTLTTYVDAAFKPVLTEASQPSDSVSSSSEILK